MPSKRATPTVTPGTDWTQAQRAARGELMVSRRIRPEDVPIWQSVVQPGETAGATIWRLVMAEYRRLWVAGLWQAYRKPAENKPFQEIDTETVERVGIPIKRY